MGFTHQQSANGVSVNTNINQISAVFTNNPAAGNLVCVTGLFFSNQYSSGTPTVTIEDANNNTYTQSTKSPFYNMANNLFLYMGYLLVAPGNASKTITASFSISCGTGSYVDLWADEFSYTGSISFDNDATNNSAGSSATTCNLPSIPVSGGLDILYGFCAANGDVTGVGGAWVQNLAGGGSDTTGCAYILSASSNTALDFTLDAAGWFSMGMSIKTNPAFEPDEDFFVPPKPQLIDPLTQVWG